MESRRKVSTPNTLRPDGWIASSESASESARSESRCRYRRESSSWRTESDIANSESGVCSESASCGERMPSAVTASSVRGPGRTMSDVSAPDEVVVEEILGIAGRTQPRPHLVLRQPRLLELVAELADQIGLVLEQVPGLIGIGELLARPHLHRHLRGEGAGGNGEEERERATGPQGANESRGADGHGA